MSALEGGGWSTRPVQPTVGHGCPLCVDEGGMLVCTERRDEAHPGHPAKCQACGGFIEHYDSPYGDWWSHVTHPEDGHDAVPPREPQVPHEWVPGEDRAGKETGHMVCGWCGLTKAETVTATGRRDLCGILPSERWDGSSD